MLLTDAFAHYGAKLKNPNWSVSAENDDGELVVSLWKQFFRPPEGKTIKYCDNVERWGGHGNREFSERINRAFSSNQIVRAVIATTSNQAAIASGLDASKLKNMFHVRDDWFGKVVVWDKTHFEILFEKMP